MDMSRDRRLTSICAWYLGQGADGESTRRAVGDFLAPAGTIATPSCKSARMALVVHLLDIFDAHLERAPANAHAHGSTQIDQIAVDVFRVVLAAPCGCPVQPRNAVPVNRLTPPKI